MDLRELKALEIAARVPLVWRERTCIVPSQSGDARYKVERTLYGYTCTCEDYQLRQRDCKHIIAARLVLCDLEGLTNEQAALRLGCPKGTVLSRLSRARELLRHRLNRRGVTVTTAALTALVAENATAGVPTVLLDNTLTSALIFASGQSAAGALSSPAEAIAEGVLRAMHLVKLKIAVAFLLLVAVAGSGTGFFVYGRAVPAVPVEETEKIAQKSEIKKDDKAKTPAQTETRTKPEPAKAKNPAKELFDRLHSPVEFGGVDDPKMTLQDALQYLDQVFKLPSAVDDKAFQEAGYKDKSVQNEPIAGQPIPKMRGVSLATVLRKILSRITTPPGQEATYLIRNEQIVITTLMKARIDAFRDHSQDVSLLNVVYEKRPLNEVLMELTVPDGLNLVIDPRVDEKAKNPVSATLLNVPADTAIRVLADMADLQPAFLDNVIYLTSKENAKRLEQETKKRPPAPEPRPAMN